MSPSASDASVPRTPFDCELIATAPAQTEHAERGEHQAGQPSADYRAGDEGTSMPSALSASGHAAAPPISVMNSRRLVSDMDW
jgi:hypothetical protein